MVWEITLNFIYTGEKIFDLPYSHPSIYNETQHLLYPPGTRPVEQTNSHCPNKICNSDTPLYNHKYCTRTVPLRKVLGFIINFIRFNSYIVLVQLLSSKAHTMQWASLPNIKCSLRRSTRRPDVATATSGIRFLRRLLRSTLDHHMTEALQQRG